MNDPLPELRRRLARRHHLLGWWGLLLFLTLGIVLETLHGFKVGYYLDPAHRTRRLLWTLAHAHGTLLALIHIAFAVGLTGFGRWTERRLKLASFLLIDAVLLPVGFFLGGVGHTEVDPSAGVLLVPAGALFLFVAVALIAWAATGSDTPTPPDSSSGNP
jgi:hypothetical protein